MNELIMVLLVIVVGLSAYAQARRQGVWSWRSFGKTMLGATVLVAVAVGAVVWLGSVLDRDHAWLGVLVELFVIAAGVSILALWLRPKPPRGKR
jgi:hypothetical protein